MDLVRDNIIEVPEVLEKVYQALSEKGYNPVSQVVGYIMSGDPTYITSYKGARGVMQIMPSTGKKIAKIRPGPQVRHCGGSHFVVYRHFAYGK